MIKSGARFFINCFGEDEMKFNREKALKKYYALRAGKKWTDLRRVRRAVRIGLKIWPDDEILLSDKMVFLES